MVSIPKLKRFSILFGLWFITSIVFNTYSSVSGYNYDYPQLSSNNYLHSRIIFTGFDRNIMEFLITPSGLYNSYLDDYSFSQNEIGKSFRIYHTFELASTSFDENFFIFLNSSAIPDTLTDNDGTTNKYRRIHPRQFNYTGRFISANTTINWITNNYDSHFGEAPIPGYTIILANMTRLDDHNYPAHWYNETYIDPDSNATFRKNYMTGYGSQYRTYYLDLSADSYYLQDAGENGTLQEISRFYDYSTEFGLSKLSEFLSNWIYEIERNLFVQNPIYQPLIPIGDSSTGIQYSFDILVINNVTGYSTEDLYWTINETIILNRLEELHPNVRMDINVKFANLTDLMILNAIIDESIVSWGDFKTLVNSKYTIDLMPIYNHLVTSGHNYLPYNFTSTFFTVQFRTYAFLFDDALFGISEKAQLEPELLGISLRTQANSPLTIISHNFDYLYENRSNPKKSHGLSKRIIHELGHQLSLMHPFQYGEIGNFVDDVMAYYPESSRFSIFSRDNMQRAYIDKLLDYSRTKILRAAELSRRKIYSPSIVNFFDVRTKEYNEIVNAYNNMNFKEANYRAFTLYKSLINFDPEFSQIPDMRRYTDVLPILFVSTLFFASLATHYYVKYQVSSRGRPKRELFTMEMRERLEEKTRERVIASHREARKKIDKIQKK